jgi:serine/threonine protein kinase
VRVVIAAAPGTLVGGDFRVVRPLASGGMGAVYVAEQLSTGRLRALKLMRPELLRSRDLRARFEREARMSASIASAHVVEVIAAGTEPVPFLAMELLEGTDLDARVEEGGPLPLAAARAVLEELCHAVAAAHDAGLVHRDLKPANVFLARTRRAGGAYTVKVLDFGIAKVLGGTTAGQTGALGSPLWMAPEQAEEGPVTPRADIWALGLVAFYVLAGRPFWMGARDDASVGRLLKEVLFEPLPRASDRARELGAPGGLPTGFDEVFGRSVTRPVEARYASVRELWHNLSRVLDAASGRSPSEPPGAASFASAWPSSRPPSLGPEPTSAAVVSAPSASSQTPARSFVPPEPSDRGGPLSATRPVVARGALSKWTSQKTVLLGALVAGAAAWGAVAWGSRAPASPASEASPVAPEASPVAPEASPVAPEAALAREHAAEPEIVPDRVPPAPPNASALASARPSVPRAAPPAAPVKEGTLPAGVVEARLRRGMERLVCPKGEPTTETELTASVDFWIQVDGGVSQVRVSGLPPGYRSCVMSQLAHIAYPKPKGGPVHVIVHALRVRLAKPATAKGATSAPAP